MQMDFTTNADSGQSLGGCQTGAAGAARAAGAGVPAALAVAASGGLPPDGHTGAVNTIGIVVDYLEVTFKTLPLEAVLEFFTPQSGEGEGWTELPCGRHGYRRGLVRGLLRVYHDGSEEMGIHVTASGQGCRQLEAEGIVRAWEGSQGFVARLLAAGAEASRVDIALDDRLGYLQPEGIEAAVREGRCISRFRQADPRSKINLKDGSAGGWSMYLGAASSRVRVRFYDKAAEQREKGCAVEGHWMRCELQARDERAEWVLHHLMTEGAPAIAGLVFAYVDFKEPGQEDTNRSRWRSCTWWMEFLGEVEKRRVTVAQVVRSIEQVAAWFKRQVAPSFAMLAAAGDYGRDWLEDALANGVARLKPWQWAAAGVS